MPIIYTYPKLSNPTGSELVLISDTDNKTKQVAISDINDLVDCVRTLNGFSGQVKIVAGDNISIDEITGANEIQINGDVNATGNNGEFAFFAGTGSDLQGSDLLTTGSNRIYLKDYIYHGDNGPGVNDARFGFNDVNSFLVYLDDSAQERLTLSDDSFRVYTGLTPKISAGDTYAALSHELVTADPEKSQATLKTTENGVSISTTYRSDTPSSDLGFGGQIKFLTSASSSTYVGLMGPITSELSANYNLMLPNEPGTGGQLLAVGANLLGTAPNQFRQLEWVDGGSAVGVTQLTAGTGVTLSPSSGLGVVEISASGTSGCSDVFKTIKVGAEEVDAENCDDTLEFVAGTGIGITLDTNTKQIEIDTSAVTGGGSATEVAFYSGASAITGNPSVRIKNNTGILYVGDVDQDDAGEIHIENEGGNAGGKLRLYGAESNTTRDKYVVLNASDSGSATAYDLYFPPTAASAAGKVLKSEGANGKLVWGDDDGGTIGGEVSQNFIPFGTSEDTLADSIMDQDISGLPHRINISSPNESVGPGNSPKYPCLRLTSNGQNSAWSSGDELGSIEFYHNEGSTPTNPHVSAFIKNVASKDSQGSTATGSDLRFGTAEHNIIGDALTSMTLIDNGELRMTQVGADGDASYRAGNVSVQRDGEFRLYGGAFTGSKYSLKHETGVLKIGQLSSTQDQEGIAFYLNGSQKVFLNEDGILKTYRSGSNVAHVEFVNNSSTVGSITSNSTSTSYNTSSDYRLKENVVEMTGSVDRVKQLKPKRFNFIADPSVTVDGFLAHEAQAIVPESVTGAKDQVDKDSDPIYQGIDQSKLVPLLVGAIKELTARIEALEG